MASISLTLAMLPLILGVSPSNLERVLRALRAARLLPLGKPGGGKGAAHYYAIHFAYILLGLAGVLPSDAPEAVRALGPLHWFRQPLPEGIEEPCPQLEDMLAEWVQNSGAARRGGGAWFPDAEAVLRSWTMQLCLNPLYAIISVRMLSGEDHTMMYGDAPATDNPGVRRVTIINGDVLLAVGELLADTEKDLAIPAPSFLDQMRANASQKVKSAGSSSPGVPTPSDDQSRANGTDSCPSRLSDSTSLQRTFQGRSLGGADHHSRNEFDLTLS